ncbi:MAG: A/G-specific adenine glycosylase, partial [Planctomycetota bacterium]
MPAVDGEEEQVEGRSGAAEVAFDAPADLATRSIRRELTLWYAANKRDLPWRRTSDPYAIWVSEAMLQQTRVETVKEYWPRFLERFPTASALAAAEEEAVLEAWSGLGYYRRARSLQAAARVIAEEHGGVFPKDLGAALDLPGVGPYTAGAVVSIAYDVPAPLVDGNVERVFARLFGMEGIRGSGPLGRACWTA